MMMENKKVAFCFDGSVNDQVLFDDERRRAFHACRGVFCRPAGAKMPPAGRSGAHLPDASLLRTDRRAPHGKLSFGAGAVSAALPEFS